MKKVADYDELIVKIRGMCTSEDTRESKLTRICHLLKDNVSYYDWVGFYLTDPQAERDLILGPYMGAPTEHTRIQFGQGICGQAADTEKTFVIQDVSLESNYLSCSPDVRAEIVVPIFKNEKVIGELDIDSHHLSPFTQDDQHFLSAICSILSTLF